MIYLTLHNSWTPDEDFHLLLNALCLVDKSIPETDRTRIVCIITGEGPLKKYYEELIDQCRLQHVIIKTMYFL